MAEHFTRKENSAGRGFKKSTCSGGLQMEMLSTPLKPITAERTPWHQDQPYWAVTGRQVASIWLPLDPVDRSASIRYVKGSHNLQLDSPRPRYVAAFGVVVHAFAKHRR
jgi:ectoine hydroxylase-related dioxygenase (phytanoyl-CoA dioxygenase family)